jgi:carboxyl-terminal processing protease
MSMSRRIKVSLVIASFGIVALFAFAGPGEKYFDIAKNLDIFATLFKEVNANYVDEVDPKKLINTGIHGMLESLDPYTDYIPEEDLEAFSIQMTGQYAGIGALIGVIDKKIVITEPYEGFPAYRAGVRVGDELVSIDGKNVQGKSTSETSAMLKGNPETPVDLILRRSGQKENLHFKINREKIKISNVVYKGIIDGDIGYIKLDEFTRGAGKEVEEALVKLKDKGARKIILDLRDNPGGLLYQAIDIVNIFIPKGLEVVSTKGKVLEWNKTYTTLNNPVDTEIPIAVITSQGSASASEIVAGALQDYDRAVLVGQKTFGKGLVQETRQLSYNTQLKITTAKYYIPSGRCIQALDYTHRRSDGTVVRVADSLKSEFKTKSGRKVYDGGGLDPDILVKDEFLGTVTSELITSGLIFQYATFFCNEHPAIPATMKNFQISDSEYNSFVAWLKERNFTYSTDLEKQTDNLIASAKNERVYQDLQVQLQALKTKVDHNHVIDMARFKNEIKLVLEQQIAFHYRLDVGQAEVSVDRDPEILEAKKALSDMVAYKKILSPH